MNLSNAFVQELVVEVDTAVEAEPEPIASTPSQHHSVYNWSQASRATGAFQVEKKKDDTATKECSADGPYGKPFCRTYRLKYQSPHQDQPSHPADCKCQAEASFNSVANGLVHDLSSPLIQVHTAEGTEVHWRPTSQPLHSKMHGDGVAEFRLAFSFANRALKSGG